MTRWRWAQPVLVQLARTGLAVVVVTVLGTYAFAVAGFGTHVVGSASMEPALAAGDVLVSRPAGEDLRAGQIVLVRAPGPPAEDLSHRVVEVRRDGSVVTQGDAAADADFPVPRSWVREEAVARIPWIGMPSVWLRRGNWAALILGAVLLIALTWAATRPLTPRPQSPQLR